MLIPSLEAIGVVDGSSLSRRVNANSQRMSRRKMHRYKLIKKGEC